MSSVWPPSASPQRLSPRGCRCIVTFQRHLPSFSAFQPISPSPPLEPFPPFRNALTQPNNPPTTRPLVSYQMNVHKLREKNLTCYRSRFVTCSQRTKWDLENSEMIKRFFRDNEMKAFKNNIYYINNNNIIYYPVLKCLLFPCLYYCIYFSLSALSCLYFNMRKWKIHKQFSLALGCC